MVTGIEQHDAAAFVDLDSQAHQHVLLLAAVRCRWATNVAGDIANRLKRIYT